jgi:hypothetical protein
MARELNYKPPLGHGHSEFMDAVMRPLMEMFDVEEVDEMPSPIVQNMPYNMSASVGWYNQTGHLPTFEPNKLAVDWAQQYRSCVTVSLRETKYFRKRNSNINEWIKAANFIKGLGRRTIFIRDTANSYQHIDGHEICPEAAIDLHKRLALYRAASMNLFIANGPGGLALAATDIPYIIMHTEAAFEQFSKCHTQFDAWAPPGVSHDEFSVMNLWKSWIGFNVGEQTPWCNPKIQRIVWDEDTAENIIAAYLDLTNQAEHLAAAE